MKDWEKYQHQASWLLGELGFTTEVNARLTEANGAANMIDVAARRTVAGVDLLWIIECKYWNKPVDMGAVRDLRTLVLDLGADRGLLMSESGFQSGAIMTAKQKNITLTSLDDLRENADDEILAARFAVAERRLIELTFRVNEDLRPSADSQLRRMISAFAARLPPEAVAEFAARSETTECFPEGMRDIVLSPDELSPDERPAFESYDGERPPGTDKWGMVLLSSAVRIATLAMNQARLGWWPVYCFRASGERGFGVQPRLAWSMAQLIDVVEASLPTLDREAAEQAANVKAARLCPPPL